MNSTDQRGSEKSPIFVVGCSRSGTTLLRLMLTCHPDVSIPPESPFITKLYPKWGHIRIQTVEETRQLCDDLFSSDNKFRDWGLSPREILENLEAIRPYDFREFVDAVYCLYLKRMKKNTAQWGDKNPRHTNHIGLLMKVFPKAKFIHIIRDGRAVLNSFINANRKHGKIYPDTPYEAAQYWRNTLRVAYTFRKVPSYFEIHYEKLVGDPGKELLRLCRFLGIRYLPREMLSYPSVNANLQLVPKDRLSWHEATLRPVDISKVSKWSSQLRRSHAVYFELCAGWELDKYGYDVILPFSRLRFLNHAFRRFQEILRN